jgi:DinB superfamily
MAVERKLAIPEGYDSDTNPRVASFAAQLDDQLTILKKNTADLETRHLEWQPHPGVNSVGMLLAHLAIVDVWWIRIAARGAPEADREALMRDIIGIGMDDDGLPLAPDGLHPPSLAGKTIDQYMRMIDAARAATHEELRRWFDSDLATPYLFRDRSITREWTAYHVLEHFSSHHGQILLLKHLMRDAGLLQH